MIRISTGNRVALTFGGLAALLVVVTAATNSARRYNSEEHRLLVDRGVAQHGEAGWPSKRTGACTAFPGS